MRLFEAIVEANHRAVAGDPNAGVRPADFENELPIIALTCVDPRLNAFFPNVLGIPAESFIWLRNAGNIITGPVSSTMRSLALACAVKGGKEIAVIGHTDCQVGRTTAAQLIDLFKGLGIERHRLPENLTEFFGMFGSERQNVIKSCDFIRQSPVIGPKIPVHGFLVNIETGKLEWVVNGYQTFAPIADRWNEVVRSAGETVDAMKALGDFKIGEMKFPETKIGETVAHAEQWLSQKIGNLEIKPAEPGQAPRVPETAVNIAKEIVNLAGKHWPKPSEGESRPPSAPPRMPPPPRIRMQMRKGGK